MMISDNKIELHIPSIMGFEKVAMAWANNVLDYCGTEGWKKIVSLKRRVGFRGTEGNLSLFKGRKTIQFCDQIIFF